MMTREQIENMTFKKIIETLDDTDPNNADPGEIFVLKMIVESLLAKAIDLSETSEGL
jgi:hypothetical protein